MRRVPKRGEIRFGEFEISGKLPRKLPDTVEVEQEHRRLFELNKTEDKSRVHQRRANFLPSPRLLWQCDLVDRKTGDQLLSILFVKAIRTQLSFGNKGRVVIGLNLISHSIDLGWILLKTVNKLRYKRSVW